jgi:hypothetical protein
VTPSRHGSVDLSWIPLGADAHVVRLSGAVFEALAALVERRPRCALYHSALRLQVVDVRYVVEQAPVVNTVGPNRGVVAEGPVGARWAGHLRRFRYEVRCWRGGEILDVGAAVGSPVRISDGVGARRRRSLVGAAPSGRAGTGMARGPGRGCGSSVRLTGRRGSCWRAGRHR